MTRVPFLRVIRPSDGRVWFPFVHVTLGIGMPFTVQLIDSLVSITVKRFWPIAMLTVPPVTDVMLPTEWII